MESYIIGGWVFGTITIIAIIEMIGGRMKTKKSNRKSVVSDTSFLFLLLGKVFLVLAGVLLFFEYVIDKL